MAAQHQVIPIFIPQKACPYRCVYCNQFAIAGQAQVPSPAEAQSVIEQYIRTMNPNSEKRIAFFGGSFTGMSMAEQDEYLDMALPYVGKYGITGIQMSTRPDYITQEILDNLKRKGVTLIELGAQSLHDNILKKVGRGHTVAQVEEASNLIIQNGFQLGLQMMIGLPGDTKELSMQTAEKIVSLGAYCTRIYPTLVVKDTLLARWYQEGKYSPLSVAEAVDWCKDIYSYFIEHNVTVLRVGLHPSEGLLSGTDYLAGPFHVSFKELVLSALWHDKLWNNPLVSESDAPLVITVHPSQINYAIGYQSCNRKALLERHPSVKFKTDEKMKSFSVETL